MGWWDTRNNCVYYIRNKPTMPPTIHPHPSFLIQRHLARNNFAVGAAAVFLGGVDDQVTHCAEHAKCYLTWLTVARRKSLRFYTWGCFNASESCKPEGVKEWMCCSGMGMNPGSWPLSGGLRRSFVSKTKTHLTVAFNKGFKVKWCLCRVEGGGRWRWSYIYTLEDAHSFV